MSKLIVLVLVLGLLVAGCSSIEIPPDLVNSTPGVDILPDLEPVNETPYPKDAPPGTVTWISPGKVEVRNFFAGARAEWNVTIHNGNSKAAEFTVKYRKPDYVASGYTEASLEAESWITITDPKPTLLPRETRDILVVVEIPEGAVVEADKWEFWISIKDITQGGLVQSELCSRWLIEMR